MTPTTPRLIDIATRLERAARIWDAAREAATSALRAVVGDGTGDPAVLEEARALAGTYGVALVLHPIADEPPTITETETEAAETATEPAPDDAPDVE